MPGTRSLLLGLALASLALPVFGEAGTSIPNYLGFYFLGIPDFVWVEGAQVKGSFERVSGTLDMDHLNEPKFVTPGRDPIPLTLGQMSRLLLASGSKGKFDLLGIDGSSTSPDGTVHSFFVVFSAEGGGQVISLVPTALSATGPADKPEPRKGGSPGAGPGGRP